MNEINDGTITVPWSEISGMTISSATAAPTQIIRDGHGWTSAIIDENVMQCVQPVGQKELIDKKLKEFSDKIYNILKDLGRIEISREEWNALLEEEDD